MLFFLIPPAILAALVIWALPETGAAPTRSMTFLFYAFLVALIAWPNYLAIALPGLPWITLVRLTSGPMALLLLICVSTSKQFRSETGDVLASSPVVWRLLVAFVVIQFLTLPFSKHLFDSINRLISAETTWTAMYFVSCYVFLRPRSVERWAGLLCALVIPIALIAIGEHLENKVLWAGHIPSFLKIEDPSTKAILAGNQRHFTGVYRSQSTFTTPLGLGEYLALTFPFILHFAVSDFSPLIKRSAFLLIPLTALTVFLSHSRVGSVGLFAGSLLYLFLFALRGRLLHREKQIYSIIVYSYPAAALMAVAASFFVGRIRRLIWGGGETQMSNEGRATQMRMAEPLLLKNPFGHGIGESGTTLNFYSPGGVLTIDSYFLSVALEYGVIGFILYYGFFAVSATYCGLEAIKNRTLNREASFVIPIAVALVTFILIKSSFSEEANHPLAFIFVGMGCALLYRIRKEARAEVKLQSVQQNRAVARSGGYRGRPQAAGA